MTQLLPDRAAAALVALARSLPGLRLAAKALIPVGIAVDFYIGAAEQWNRDEYGVVTGQHIEFREVRAAFVGGATALGGVIGAVAVGGVTFVGCQVCAPITAAFASVGGSWVGGFISGEILSLIDSVRPPTGSGD